MLILRFIARWIVQNIPCGRLAPHLFGFSIRAKKRKVRKELAPLLEPPKDKE